MTATPKRYHLKNIRTLLTEGFILAELRSLCYDVDEFRPVYDRLTDQSSKAEIVQFLIEHAYRRVLFDEMLAFIETENPGRYSLHKPYHQPDDVTTRILLIDDDPGWCEQLGGLLEDHGYQTVTASVVEEVKAHLQQDDVFDLAIIDMRLDESDENDREGVSLGYWLRDSGYQFPIIIMTAYTMEAEVVQSVTLRPFQFSVVGKDKIGTGSLEDLLLQIELAIK